LKRFGIILTILSLWVGCDEAEEAIEEELCVTESQAPPSSGVFCLWD